MWPQIVFGILLIGFSLALLRMHRLERAANAAEPIANRAIRTDRSRYQRRMLASALIGLIGILVMCELFVRHPILLAVYWSIALVIVLTVIGLGLVDLARSRQFMAELRVQHQRERAALEAELALHMKRRAAAEGRSDIPPNPPH